MQLITGTGKQRAGKASQIEIGGTALTYGSWNVNVTSTDLITTNFESYSLVGDTTYQEGILGPIEADVDFGGDWDAGSNPLDNPPGLYPRDDLASVQFITNRTDATYWDFDYMRIRGATSGATWEGKVTFTCSGKSQGPFQYPIGSV